VTGRLDAVTAVAAGSVAALAAATELPGDLALDEVRAVLHLDDRPLGSEELGSSNVQRQRWPADSALYAGGLFVYTDADAMQPGRVVLVAGLDPFDDAVAPGCDEEALDALGPPELVLDAALGGLVLTGAERVWPARGLAVRSNPDNGLLLAVMTFAPTTAEDYLARLRPDAGPRRWMAAAGGPGGLRGDTSGCGR